MVLGDQWFQDDHMVFVQDKIRAIAITSQRFQELFTTITYTTRDKMELVDCDRLASVALAVRDLLINLDKYYM